MSVFRLIISTLFNLIPFPVSVFSYHIWKYVCQVIYRSKLYFKNGKYIPQLIIIYIHIVLSNSIIRVPYDLLASATLRHPKYPFRHFCFAINLQSIWWLMFWNDVFHFVLKFYVMQRKHSCASFFVWKNFDKIEKPFQDTK